MNKSKLAVELEELLAEEKFADYELVEKFLERVNKGDLTKQENFKSHFCAYSAAYDPRVKEFFIGHHKKSELWLFNGRHIDENETIKDCLIREIGEE